MEQIENIQSVVRSLQVAGGPNNVTRITASVCLLVSSSLTENAPRGGGGGGGGGGEGLENGLNPIEGRGRSDTAERRRKRAETGGTVAPTWKL